MPIGDVNIVKDIVFQLDIHKPKRILDLGCGSGFYGVCIRQWLDFGVKPYNTYIHGVEGFNQYINPNWMHYDKITLETVQNFLANTKDTFDAIIFTDVLEHLTESDGKFVIENCKRILNKGGIFLCGTPSDFFEQGAVYGNPLEIHRSLWTSKQFKDFGFTMLMENPSLLGIYNR